MIEKECLNIDGKYFDEHHIFHIYETETDKLYRGFIDNLDEAYAKLKFYAEYLNVPLTHFKIVEEIIFRKLPYEDEPCGYSDYPPYTSED